MIIDTWEKIKRFYRMFNGDGEIVVEFNVESLLNHRQYYNSSSIKQKFLAKKAYAEKRGDTYVFSLPFVFHFNFNTIHKIDYDAGYIYCKNCYDIPYIPDPDDYYDSDVETTNYFVEEYKEFFSRYHRGLKRFVVHIITRDSEDVAIVTCHQVRLEFIPEENEFYLSLGETDIKIKLMNVIRLIHNENEETCNVLVLHADWLREEALDIIDKKIPQLFLEE